MDTKSQYRRGHLRSSAVCTDLGLPRSHLLLGLLWQKRQKIAQVSARQSLKDDDYVTVHSSSSMLEGLAHAGDGKAEIIPAILSTISESKIYLKGQADWRRSFQTNNSDADKSRRCQTRERKSKERGWHSSSHSSIRRHCEGPSRLHSKKRRRKK